MKIFESELAIPEFDKLPYKEARQVWRQFYWGNRDWSNLTILIGPFMAGIGAGIAAICFRSESLLPVIIGSVLGAQLGYEIHRQIMIHHLRPKIRQYLSQRQETA